MECPQRSYEYVLLNRSVAAACGLNQYLNLVFIKHTVPDLTALQPFIAGSDRLGLRICHLHLQKWISTHSMYSSALKQAAGTPYRGQWNAHHWLHLSSWTKTGPAPWFSGYGCSLFLSEYFYHFTDMVGSWTLCLLGHVLNTRPPERFFTLLLLLIFLACRCVYFELFQHVLHTVL